MINGDVNYEMAWRFLKKLVEQFKSTHANTAKDKTENAIDRNYSKLAAHITGIILEKMECMEEGIADAMRGQEADEVSEKQLIYQSMIDRFLMDFDEAGSYRERLDIARMILKLLQRV